MLLVDAANVVGSRPDGWWRDRAGAAARLVDRLAAVPGARVRTDGGEAVVATVVAVLEGAARAGVPAGPVGGTGVVVRHAPGSGDDALAALAGPGMLLVTADRGLAARARSAGAQVARPSWLLGLLPP